ncbi:MAG: bifunctional 4-hydroxy-2-oxoglutarate aldolase/2-dehydro-3-deoxy-phosphogluconate aldolase [Melioribacteraceae bacterium]|nr:bifunctional 4-hydroxy-2-oxoglutarate aldolase/2-dehydro-3-deoxy-phosphogluconate aldolase [Melioribacteraceae bacterium]
MSRELILNKILERKAVSVIRLKDSGKLKKVIEALEQGGITVAEITMTVPNAIDLIKKISNEVSENIIVGVGSVLNAKTANEAIKAGAKYVVSPILKKEIIETSHENDIPVMPGCFTPSEIYNAYELGADIIKVFPADVLGMNFFKGVLAPMPFLKLMPTGGVTLTNVTDWLNAGAVAVGLGTSLLNKEAIENENYDLLTQNAKIITESINQFLMKVKK